MKGILRRFILAAFAVCLNGCGAQPEAMVASPQPPMSEGQLARLNPAVLPKGPLSCVPYARLVTGLPIRGDAWTWWAKANGAYLRGLQPQVGSVLVFKRTQRLQRGHVSVVARIINAREILVTHANWGSTPSSRGKVSHDVRVADVSPANNWSEVKVWNEYTGSFGRTYPTYGFIYRPAATQPAAVSTLPPSAGPLAGG
ncbi:MAG: CHAP domain-containing protein [Dongiaceae bacterium]